MAEWAVWTRRLAVATAIVFFVSTAFPVVAGLSRNPAGLPRAWGMLDVVCAFVFTSMAIVMTVLVGRFIPKAAEAAAYRAYRFLTHGILGMVVIFLLVGDRIAWAILL